MEKVKEMTFTDVVKLAVGMDENRSPRSAFIIKNGNDKVPAVIGGWTYCRMVYGNDFITIDLVFKGANTPELKTVWNKLEKYGEQGIVSSELDIMPIECDGRFYLKAINPEYWVLQPERVGERDLNVIRILYDNENVQAVSSGVLIKSEDTAEELAESKLGQELHLETFK